MFDGFDFINVEEFETYWHISCILADNRFRKCHSFLFILFIPLSCSSFFVCFLFNEIILIFPRQNQSTGLIRQNGENVVNWFWLLFINKLVVKTLLLDYIISLTICLYGIWNLEIFLIVWCVGKEQISVSNRLIRFIRTKFVSVNRSRTLRVDSSNVIMQLEL